MTDAVVDKTGEDAIVVAPTKGHVMDVASSTLAVELPCGYVDAAGAVHRELVVAEMSGEEEDLLAGKGPVLQRLNQIILNCTRRLGAVEGRAALSPAISSLTAADRMVAFLALRRVSLGDFYEVKVKCPASECKEDVRYTLNLAEVEIRAMADPTKREFVSPLASKRTVKWHIMTSTDEEWLSERGKKRENVLSLALLARVDSIDGVALDREKKGYAAALAVVKALPLADRNEIRREFEKYEGHVDTKVEFKCPSCGFEWKDELNIGQPSFFFPSDR